MQPSMTTHRMNGLIIHADRRWNNGNSPVGLALAARAFAAGQPTPSHAVHPASATCEHCA